MKQIPIYLIHKGSGQKYLLAEENTIGRGIDADENPYVNICLPDEAISREHAKIKLDTTSKRWLFINLSRNGSLVNQKAVTKDVFLRHGDIISMGDTDLSFYEKLRSQEETMEMPIVKRRKNTVVTQASDWENNEETPLGSRLESIIIVFFLIVSAFLLYCCVVW